MGKAKKSKDHSGLILLGILKGQKLKDMTKTTTYFGIVSFSAKAIDRYLENLPEMQENVQQLQSVYNEFQEYRSVQFEDNYKFFVDKLEQGEYEIELSTAIPIIIYEF